MLLERYCTCGAVLKTNVPRTKRQQALIAWYDRHSGPGHEDATAAQAEAARMGMGRETQRTGR